MKFKNFLPKRNQQEGELKIQFCNARYVHKLQHPWSESLCKLEVETKEFSDFKAILFLDIARTYLQLPLRQWGTGNVYHLVLSSWKVNIAENPIAVMGL